MTTRIADTMQATAIDRASNQLKRSGGIRINLKLPESKKQLSCRANTTNKPTRTNDTIHVYNAIKLTNYFTNLLQQQQQFLLQLKRTTTTMKLGETWRQTQLKQQIPQQDMKLLSDIPEQPEEQANIISDAEGRLQDDSSASSTGHQNATEEIKFIRGQRESASRFKASLYYLNPLQKQQAASNGNHHMQLHLQPGQEASSEQSNNKADSSHCCFKCKKSIYSGTTCVRVDNLQVYNNNSQQVDSRQRVECLKGSSQIRNHRSKSGQNGTEVGAIINMGATQEKQTTSAGDNTKATSQQNEEKSSSDEGLGSGQSSGQSSTAGSHCDDRETPPHMGTVDAEMAASSSRREEKQQQQEHCSKSCDKLELSFDSLNIKNNQQDNGFSNSKSGQQQQQRNKVRVAKANNQKAGQSSSATRKSRTLTWSASLGSLGASLKLGASKQQSRSDTDLKSGLNDDDDEQENNGQGDTCGSSTGPEGKSPEDTETVYFHTDCFCCTTCNELLVDLRALIHVNDPIEQQQHQQQQQLQKENNQDKQQDTSSSEYVNLPNEVKQNEHQTTSGLDNKKQHKATGQQQLTLYCHRHFVELFKPRCQQCDCLILDEECTEAEGKVWHIKHFCCTDCKVPLGGHQYIIVDQTLTKAKHSVQPTGGRRNGGEQKVQNAPYCLQCFDRIFGETCEECNKLITCDSGAINHEQRCWHASPLCFKCHRCSRSLLGVPFLPSHDGRIYCSVNCSELSNNQRNRPCSAAAATTGGQQQTLSLAHYSDPRAPAPGRPSLPGGRKPRLEGFDIPALGDVASAPTQHRQLIECLISSAHLDETSFQLLDYLYVQLKDKQKPIVNGERDSTELAKLLKRIEDTLSQIQTRKPTGLQDAKQQHEEQLRRNKLNPFLIDSMVACSGNNNNNNHDKVQLEQHQPAYLMSLMMDRAGAAARMKPDGGQLVNYINLDDCVLSSSKNNGKKLDANLDTVDNGTQTLLRHHQVDLTRLQHHQLQQQQHHLHRHHQVTASQCSPVASLISNEGALSDHSSATSSGVSTAPPLGSLNGSLKSHSPLSSTSSHSSVSSGTGSGGGGSGGGQNNGNKSTSTTTGQLQPQQQTQTSTTNSTTRQQPNQQISSIAATLERRRRVQPITELSVVDLLTVADNQLADKSGPAPADGFDQLVSQFEANKSANSRQSGLVSGQFGTTSSSSSGSGKQQPDSFFFELAQRLPKARAANQQAATSEIRPVQHLVAAINSGPLDTNGLPSVETMRDQKPPVVTDHYSTVNKANKFNRSANPQQVASGGASATTTGNAHDAFFAITSPLLACQTDNSIQPAQETSLLTRPTSSLSILAPSAGFEPNQLHHQQVQPLHGSYSTSSLHRMGLDTSQLLLQASSTSASQMQPTHQQQPQQKPLTRPAKSVSFDPTVKDPPSSSMTLGRSSALKSALKTPANWQQQQQRFLAMEGQHQFNIQANSSATMPASLANQLKAMGSLKAYSAHYDEQGRRIKLSSLLNQQQIMGAECGIAEQQQQQQPEQTGSRSFLSGALSKLTSQTSRGGRREERKLREHQQQQQQLTIQTQPMSSHCFNPIGVAEQHQQQFAVQPNMEAFDQQQQVFMQQPLPSGSGQVRPTKSRKVSERRRRHHHGHHHHRRSHRAVTQRASSSRARHGAPSKRSQRRSRPKSRPSCNSRRCYDDEYSDGDDDDDYSSQCSTCSSSGSSSESELSETEHGDSDDSTSYCDSDDYSDHSETTSRSSYTSYTSGDSYSSGSSSAGSSRSSSPCSSDHEDEHRSVRPGSPLARQSTSEVASKKSSSRRRSTKKATTSSSTPRGRHADRRESRSSSTRSSVSSNSTSRSSGGRHKSRATGSRRHASQRSSKEAPRRHEHQRRARRPNGSSHATHRHHRRERSPPRRSSRRPPAQSRHQSSHVAHLEPQMQLQPNQAQTYYCQQPQQQVASHTQSLQRAKSPSSLSTDSKSMGNENCRII